MELNLNNLALIWNEFIQEQKKERDAFFWTQYLNTARVQSYKEKTLQITTPSQAAATQLKQEGIDNLFVNKLQTEIKIKFVIQAKHETTKDLSHPKTKSTLKNVVTGPFNKAAYDIAQKIIEQKNEWGIVFIYSEPGLGKTHLLNSIYKKNSANFKVIYKHANNFGTEVVELLNKILDEIQNYKKNFAEKNAILFDDLQILGERKKTNEILFQIINKAQELKTDLVFASDKHPEDLFGFDARLISRFLSGLVIKIDYPDIKSAKEIVKQKIKQTISNPQILDDEVIETIARVFRKDIRKMEGAVKQMAFSIEQKPTNKITPESLKQIFSDAKLNFDDKVSARKIKSIVAKHFSVTYASLISNSRKKEVVQARYVAIYLLRSLTNESHIMIARQFNARNHTTAVNATKKIREKMKQNPEYEKEINLIKEKCLND